MKKQNNYIISFQVVNISFLRNFIFQMLKSQISILRITYFHYTFDLTGLLLGKIYIRVYMLYLLYIDYNTNPRVTLQEVV